MIELLIINSFACYGFWNAANYDNETKEKGILWFIPYVFGCFPWWVRKPLYDCVSCMASIHSTYFYFYYYDITADNLIQYPLYILALSGVNILLSETIDRLIR